MLSSPSPGVLADAVSQRTSESFDGARLSKLAHIAIGMTGMTSDSG